MNRLVPVATALAMIVAACGDTATTTPPTTPTATTQPGVPIVELARADTDRAFEFRSEGKSWWGEAQSFTLPGSEHQLIMTVMVPEHELTDQLRRQLSIAFVITLFAALLAIIWAARVARSISAPTHARSRSPTGAAEIGPPKNQFKRQIHSRKTRYKNRSTNENGL